MNNGFRNHVSRSICARLVCHSAALIICLRLLCSMLVYHEYCTDYVGDVMSFLKFKCYHCHETSASNIRWHIAVAKGKHRQSQRSTGRNSNQKARLNTGNEMCHFFCETYSLAKRIFIQYNANVGWCNMLKIYSIIQSFICIIHWTHAHISRTDASLLLLILMLFSLFFFVFDLKLEIHSVKRKKKNLKKEHTNAIGFANTNVNDAIRTTAKEDVCSRSVSEVVRVCVYHFSLYNEK